MSNIWGTMDEMETMLRGRIKYLEDTVKLIRAECDDDPTLGYHKWIIEKCNEVLVNYQSPKKKYEFHCLVCGTGFDTLDEAEICEFECEDLEDDLDEDGW